MPSFYNTLSGMIKRKALDRYTFETTIATWLVKGWLTDDEATELLKLLDEHYPVD